MFECIWYSHHWSRKKSFCPVDPSLSFTALESVLHSGGCSTCPSQDIAEKQIQQPLEGVENTFMGYCMLVFKGVFSAHMHIANTSSVCVISATMAIASVSFCLLLGWCLCCSCWSWCHLSHLTSNTQPTVPDGKGDPSGQPSKDNQPVRLPTAITNTAAWFVDSFEIWNS